MLAYDLGDKVDDDAYTRAPDQLGVNHQPEGGVGDIGFDGDELDGVTGRYFDTDSKETKLHPTAYNADVQKRIVATIEQALQTAELRRAPNASASA